MGRTDNVVLYMEHLNDGGGVSGDEIVQGQIETHTWEGKERSMLHLGELFWEKDPDDRSDTPSPSMTFEVDYYAGADQALDTAAWRTAVEYNYALYGIDVEMQRDEVLGDDLVHTATVIDDRGNPVTVETFNWTEPFSQEDLFSIEGEFHDTSSEQYMVVASVADDDIPGGADQTGIHRWRELPFFFT